MPCKQTPEEQLLAALEKKRQRRADFQRKALLSGRIKLTGDLARSIKADRAEGLTYHELAEKYPVAEASIIRICRGALWRENRGPE